MTAPSNSNSKSIRIFGHVLTFFVIVMAVAVVRSLSGFRLEPEGGWQVGPTVGASLEAEKVLPQGGLPEGVKPYDVTARVTIANPTVYDHVLTRVAHTPTMIVWLVATFLLLRVVRSANEGDPFTFETVKRLRVLAIALIVSPFLLLLQNLARNELLERSQVAHLVSPDPHINVAGLAVGIVVLGIAEVLSVGIRARKEVEGLV